MKNLRRFNYIFIGFMCVLLGFTIGFTFVGWGNYQFFMENGGRCEGINNYYTGKGFWTDYNNMFDNITYKRKREILTPSELYRSGGDCKSISLAIYCLGKKYNKTCAFYTRRTFDPTKQNKILAHIGVKCKKGENWTELY